jgi:ribonuclease-3
LTPCAERTGTAWHDLALAQQALTHRSLVNEAGHEGQPDNQRLEFLGDAVVDMLVGEWLYRRYPDADEGELTGLRADIVRTQGLAAFAREIDLGSMLQLGRGEASGGGRQRNANLCATFEALVGAIYLDQGLDAARRWMASFLDPRALQIDSRRASKDAKSLLQEEVQATRKVTPVYTIVEETGLEHAKTFRALALVAGEVWGEGEGHSKQEAEQAAARAALAMLD